MNKGIANILKQQLQLLPFLDKVAGLVYTAEYQEALEPIDEEVGDQQMRTSIIKRVPLSCDLTVDNCDTAYLVPDSAKKGIGYFESGDIQFLGKQGQYGQYRSFIRCVVWINTLWIKSPSCLYTGDRLLNHVLQKLTSIQLYNADPFLGVSVALNKIPKPDKNIFAPYTYDLYNTQYLMAPFEFFALDLAIDFKINIACIADITMLSDQEFVDQLNCS